MKMTMQKMKAATYYNYGSPEVLQLETVQKPTVQDNEVLVKIHATTVSAGDWRMRRADPFAVRFFSGLMKPKNPILGHELAGEIEAVGNGVKRFKKGDLVFGSTNLLSGTYAEYISLPEDLPLAIMPEKLSFEEATAGPVGAITALYFLRKANVQAGQKILIHGASGAIGSAAVQLAKHFGAEVTGVCSTKNAALVKSLGADKVVDYKKEDFTKINERFDVVFNTVGKTSFSETKHLLTPTGTYIASDAPGSDYLQMLWAPFMGKKNIIAGVSKQRKEDILYIKQLMETGQFKPVIDRKYPLSDIVDAHRYVEMGHKKGNVVITIHQPSDN